MKQNYVYLRVIGKCVFLIIFLWALNCCYCTFSSWNSIPTHKIKAELYKLGYSDKSNCNFKIRINAGIVSRMDENNIYDNLIQLHDSTGREIYYKLSDNFKNKFRNVYDEHRDSLDSMRCFYVLDYETSTSINVSRNKSSSSWSSDEYTISYIEEPEWNKKGTTSSFSGCGFLAFPAIEGVCLGELSFSTNLLNGTPNMRSQWDITQSNYEITFKCSDINCDTISIEFIGAVQFSNMYPLPQKTTISGIEFTDSVDISHIIKHGLRFHAEFIELKEMSAKRTFLLTVILSLFISLFANFLFQLLYGRKK